MPCLCAVQDRTACYGRHLIRREYTELPKHMQNEFVKIIDCRLRNECQNENLFQTLSHARHLNTAWRDDDNHHRRPHTSLDGLAPWEYHQR